MPRRNPSRPASRPGIAPGSCIRPPCAFCGTPVPRSRVTCSPDWHRLPERLKAAWNQARAERDEAAIARARDDIRRYAAREVST
jgi:hypothetical protein